MTAILGISAFYHDSAAALVIDGEVVAAAQEERFTRKKHDYEFPAHAIRYCLDEAGLTPEQLDYVGFYDKPFLKFERLLVYTISLKYEKQATAQAKKFNIELKNYIDLKKDLSENQITREQVLRRDRNRPPI